MNEPIPINVIVFLQHPYLGWGGYGRCAQDKDYGFQCLGLARLRHDQRKLLGNLLRVSARVPVLKLETRTRELTP